MLPSSVEALQKSVVEFPFVATGSLLSNVLCRSVLDPAFFESKLRHARSLGNGVDEDASVTPADAESVLESPELVVLAVVLTPVVLVVVYDDIASVTTFML